MARKENAVHHLSKQSKTRNDCNSIFLFERACIQMTISAWQCARMCLWQAGARAACIAGMRGDPQKFAAAHWGLTQANAAFPIQTVLKAHRKQMVCLPRLLVLPSQSMMPLSWTRAFVRMIYLAATVCMEHLLLFNNLCAWLCDFQQSAQLCLIIMRYSLYLRLWAAPECQGLLPVMQVCPLLISLTVAEQFNCC